MATLHHTQVMSLMSCTCSCGLHYALQRPDATAPSLVQLASAHDAESDGEYAEQDEYQEEEHTLEVSSPHDSDESYEDSAAIEREEAEAAVITLQLQVRALRKYKSNYELLCGELGELNAQIGLQLQRHEADVAALQASIADLQTEKIALGAQVTDAQQALAVQRDTVKQDREYSEHVHRQLSTAAELLKVTENRLEQQKEQFTAEIERLRAQLAVGYDERAQYQVTAKGLEEELEALRARQAAIKKQEALQRRREKTKHKKELMARAAKFRAVSDELEAQRSSVRATKKQLAQVQTDNDALRKQLAKVKRDGGHLSDIIESQRVEYESYADELMQMKKTKTHLTKRVAVLSQETDQLQNELADAKEELVYKNNELESCRKELKNVRSELRQISQELDEGKCANERLIKQVETLQTAANERGFKAKMEQQEQRLSRERKSRNKLIRLRELLADNQQRATESSKDVQKLRHELLAVQKLVHGCTEEQDSTLEPIDQWAELMQNSVEAKESALNTAIMEKVRGFSASGSNS